MHQDMINVGGQVLTLIGVAAPVTTELLEPPRDREGRFLSLALQQVW